MTETPRSAGRDLKATRARVSDLTVAETLNGSRLSLPVFAGRTQAVPNTADDVFVVANSTVLARPWQSPSGQTEFVIFSSSIPSRCTLRIPPGTVVTELESTASTRWEDGQRRQMLVEIDRPVATLRMEWLSEKSAGDWRMSEVEFEPPAARDCRSASHVTVLPTLGETPNVMSNTTLLTAEDQTRQLTQDLQVGLDHARSGDQEGRIPETAAFQASSFLGELTASETQFLADQKSATGTRIVRAVHEPGVSIRIAYRRRLELETIYPAAIGLFVLMVASFVSAMASRPAADTATMVAEPGTSAGLSMHDVMTLEKDSQPAPASGMTGSRSGLSNGISGSSVVESADSHPKLSSSRDHSNEASDNVGPTEINSSGGSPENENSERGSSKESRETHLEATRDIEGKEDQR